MHSRFYYRRGRKGAIPKKYAAIGKSDRMTLRFRKLQKVLTYEGAMGRFHGDRGPESGLN